MPRCARALAGLTFSHRLLTIWRSSTRLRCGTGSPISRCVRGRRAPIELGDEAFRRDDAVALFDPVTEELGGDTLRLHRDVDPPGAREPVSAGRRPLDREHVAVGLDQLDSHARRLCLVVVAEEDEEKTFLPTFATRSPQGKSSQAPGSDSA